jgi:hypothetical protein
MLPPTGWFLRCSPAAQETVCLENVLDNTPKCIYRYDQPGDGIVLCLVINLFFLEIVL